MFDDWGLEGFLDTGTGSFEMPSGYFEPNYDYSFDSGFEPSYGFDSNFNFDSLFNSGYDPVTGGFDPSNDYGFQSEALNLGIGSPLLGTAENLGLIAQESQNRDEGILSQIMNSAKSGWDKAGSFIGGKNNMSTLLTLATLASLGSKPKTVNASGPAPSSVKATEIYNKFTPQQQANMESFASKKNLVPLNVNFDPRTYGYGGEIKFFDREA